MSSCVILDFHMSSCVPLGFHLSSCVLRACLMSGCVALDCLMPSYVALDCLKSSCATPQVHHAMEFVFECLMFDHHQPLASNLFAASPRCG